MGKKNQSAAPGTGQAVLRSGPDDIDFSGRHWRVGVVQPMTDIEFRQMQAHPHFALFDFTYSADPAAVPPSEEN